MTDPIGECGCRNPVLAGGEKKAADNRPECGKFLPQSSPREDSAMKDLSDSLIEATYEVLVEEGAIWSGAR